MRGGGCAPQPHTPPPVEKRFNWHRYDAQNALIEEILVKAIPRGRLRVVDAFKISNRRADRHVGINLNGQLDCLHYCLPGPPDHWNLVLAEVIRTVPRAWRPALA